MRQMRYWKLDRITRKMDIIEQIVIT